MFSDLPHPPLELANRVGELGAADPWAEYERIGAASAAQIRALLPDDWVFDDRRVLDFGCGAGRVLRQFAPDAGRAEFWGCDIDGPSISWGQENLSPPFRFLQCAELPPLPQPDSSFDLVYAISVFTHLLDSWSAWLLEMHRLLRPGGILIASFLGAGKSEEILGEPYDESRFGANQVEIGKTWAQGGPSVIHAPWWLRAHWGRAFEISTIQPAPEDVLPAPQGFVCMRKDDRPAPSIEELERPEPGEPREATALQNNVEQLKREIRSYESSRPLRMARGAQSVGRRIRGRFSR